MDHESAGYSGNSHSNGGWMINYDIGPALQNIRFMSNRLEPVHIFVSRDCAAIVISRTPLVDIREPHVMAWRDSFYSISRDELVIRAAEVANGKRDYVGQETGLPATALAC